MSIIILTYKTSFAQRLRPAVFFGANVSAALPQNRFEQLYKYGAGADIIGGIGVNKTFLMATVGFSAFKAHRSNKDGLLTYVPVKAGVRRYFFKKHIFLNADAGLADVRYNNFNRRRFIYDGGVGFRFLNGIELSIFYEGFKNQPTEQFSHFLAGKIGYNLML